MFELNNAIKLKVIQFNDFNSKIGKIQLRE